MQIKKISNNKLKVFLNSNDLMKKNIDVDSFLSNSIESQDLFYEILDLAEKQYSFNISNNKAIIEAISLDNNIFVLTITKINGVSSFVQTNAYDFFCFNSSYDFFLFYFSMLKKNYKIKDLTIYLYSDKYFVVSNSSDSFMNNELLEFASVVNSDFAKDIILEYGKRVNL